MTLPLVKADPKLIEPGMKLYFFPNLQFLCEFGLIEHEDIVNNGYVIAVADNGVAYVRRSPAQYDLWDEFDIRTTPRAGWPKDTICIANIDHRYRAEPEEFLKAALLFICNAIGFGMSKVKMTYSSRNRRYDSHLYVVPCGSSDEIRLERCYRLIRLLDRAGHCICHGSSGLVVHYAERSLRGYGSNRCVRGREIYFTDEVAIARWIRYDSLIDFRGWSRGVGTIHSALLRESVPDYDPLRLMSWPGISILWSEWAELEELARASDLCFRVLRGRYFLSPSSVAERLNCDDDLLAGSDILV